MLRRETRGNVLIVVDTLTPSSIGKSLFEAAKNLGCEVMVMTMLPRSRHGEEIPVPVAEAMKNSDVVIAPTTFSLTHTQARINACKAGARVASMPGITENMMATGGMTADYYKVNEIAIALNEKLEKAEIIRVVRIPAQISLSTLKDANGLWIPEYAMKRDAAAIFLPGNCILPRRCERHFRGGRLHERFWHP